MGRQASPFAALTGAEKQIRWLEYQSIRLPYVQTGLEAEVDETEQSAINVSPHKMDNQSSEATEKPKTIPAEAKPSVTDFQKIRHSQYDAVIARMKRAELQTHSYQTFS